MALAIQSVAWQRQPGAGVHIPTAQPMKAPTGLSLPVASVQPASQSPRTAVFRMSSAQPMKQTSNVHQTHSLAFPMYTSRHDMSGHQPDASVVQHLSTYASSENMVTIKTLSSIGSCQSSSGVSPEVPLAVQPLSARSTRLMTTQMHAASQSPHLETPLPLETLGAHSSSTPSPSSTTSTCLTTAPTSAESESASASQPGAQLSQPLLSAQSTSILSKPSFAASQSVPRLPLDAAAPQPPSARSTFQPPTPMGAASQSRQSLSPQATLSEQPTSSRSAYPLSTPPGSMSQSMLRQQLQTLAAQQPQSLHSSRSPTSLVGDLPQQPPSARSGSASLAQQPPSSRSTHPLTKPNGVAGTSALSLHLADTVRERIERLFTCMGKGDAQTDQQITVRDVLQHSRVVQALAPQLLSDFPKIDQGCTGKITAKQLESYMSPSSEAELGREKLHQIWEQLTSGREEHLPADRLFLQDLARHYDFACKHVPDLVERFQEVDTDRSCSIERIEFDAFFGNGEAWLDAKLAGIIGLHALKEQLKTFYWATKLDRLRRQAGTFVKDDEPCVLLFKGNPGVGKTTIARLVTGMLHKIGVIPSDTFVEVQRDQLVGDHIGATEKATEDAIAKAKGGVLFVDEAYRLSVDAFGVEAINCLMRAMTEKGNVIILAGYPAQMNEFICVNPGIKRRITYEFTFPDYTVDDLACIFKHQVMRRGFEISHNVSMEDIAGLIECGTTEYQRRKLNGGVGEHVCRHAIFHLNGRQIDLVRVADQNGTREPEVSVVLEIEDICYGCKQVLP